MGSASQLTALHNQTSVEQGDVPAQLGQLVLERGPENANSVSGVFSTSSDDLQGFGYELNKFSRHCSNRNEGHSPFVGGSS